MRKIVPHVVAFPPAAVRPNKTGAPLTTASVRVPLGCAPSSAGETGNAKSPLVFWKA